MRARHDVIVIGARVAGASVAMLLARHGLDVLVVDRARYGSDTVSSHALMRGGVLQLQRWGLLDAVTDANTPAVRHVLFHYPDETVRVPIRPAAGVQALYAPRRTVLDPALADAATAAGADVRFGVAVTGLLRDLDGRVRGVIARDRDGRRFEATAALTIGADGIRSTLAAAVAAPVTRIARRPGGAFLYGYWDKLLAEGYEWIFAPEASAGLIPTNGDQTLVFVGTTQARMKAARREGDGWHAFESVLARISPSVAERVHTARRPDRLRGFSGLHGFWRRPWGPGWALVGDAGGFEDPLSTHGMTDALRDAELAARAVLSIHEGTQNEAAALRRYHLRRDAMAGRLFDATEQIGSYGWTMPQLRSLLLDASSAMSEQVGELQLLGPPASRRTARGAVPAIT